MEESRLDDSPVAGLDVSALQQALSQTKVITAESSVQKKMMDKLLAAAETLKSVGADDDSLSVLVESVSSRFAQMSESAAERCTELQVAIVKSQGVHEGVDGLLSWVREAEGLLGNLVRPVHPDPDSIATKLTEAASLRRDIESRASIIDEVKKSSAAESDLPDVDAKMNDVNSRYESVASACRDHETKLQNLSGQLTEFHNAVKLLDNWLQPVFDVLDSRDVLSEARLKEIADDVQAHRSDVDNIRQLASEITSSPVATDSHQVRETVSEMERVMQDLQKSLSAREQEGELRGQRSGRFEDLRQAVVSWLKEKEEQTEAFEPVAVSMELLATQLEQIKVAILHIAYHSCIIGIMMVCCDKRQLLQC